MKKRKGANSAKVGDSQAVADDHFSDVERRTPIYSV
jgi:hypothetical protein